MMTRLNQDPAPFRPVTMRPEPIWRGDAVAVVDPVVDLDQRIVDYIESLADRMLVSHVSRDLQVHEGTARLALERLASAGLINRQTMGANRGTLYWSIKGVN